jgi:hypothetical protein
MDENGNSCGTWAVEKDASDSNDCHICGLKGGHWLPHVLVDNRCSMNIAFLDDDAVRTKKFLSSTPSAQTAVTAEEMIALLQKEQEWEYVFLDHDLGGEIFVDPNNKNTGSEVARWIVANKPKITSIIVHSLNFDASRRMVSDLVKAGYNTHYIPFTSFKFWEDSKMQYQRGVNTPPDKFPSPPIFTEPCRSTAPGAWRNLGGHWVMEKGTGLPVHLLPKGFKIFNFSFSSWFFFAAIK